MADHLFPPFHEEPFLQGLSSFEEEFALVQPSGPAQVELAARLEAAGGGGCIALRSDGRPCGLTVTAVDPFRGGMVCALHDPEAP